MEKRIFRSMSLLVLLTVLFFAMLWGVSTALRLPDEAKQGLKDLRVTVLDETGQVLFDSERNPGGLENHIDRAEVQQAISAGWGESERFSATLGGQNYYYAKVMEDGRIIDRGTHAELLNSSQTYQEIVSTQLRAEEAA